MSDSTEFRVTIEVISGFDSPVLTKGMPGMEDIKYGMEGGTVIQSPDGYHLFTAEMVGDPHWVKMKLGHWLSTDGKNWKRISTLLELNPIDNDLCFIENAKSVVTLNFIL